MRSLSIIFGIVLLGLLLMFLVSPKPPAGGMKHGTPEDNTPAASTAQAAKPSAPSTPTEVLKPPMQGAFRVIMSVKDRGDVTIELYPAAAPATVKQFTEWITSGYYNGIKFHRVVPNFVVQAGDPQTRSISSKDLAAMTPDQISSAHLGASGSGQNIPFEQNKLQNITGTIAMALSSPRSNTASGQFYINLKSNHDLDGDYCVFGKVVSGMDVVQKIQQGDEITSMKVIGK